MNPDRLFWHPTEDRMTVIDRTGVPVRPGDGFVHTATGDLYAVVSIEPHTHLIRARDVNSGFTTTIHYGACRRPSRVRDTTTERETGIMTETVLRVAEGQHITRADADGRRIKIEFVANRHGTAPPLTLRKGCQTFRPGLALNNGGSVSATDHPDQFHVTMVGTGDNGMFTVPTRDGGTRSVTYADLNSSIDKATIYGPVVEYISELPGIFHCLLHSDEHFYVAQRTVDGQRQGQFGVVLARGSVWAGDEGEGFAHWPRCRPVRLVRMSTPLGRSISREREQPVRVHPDQFRGVTRVPLP